MASFDPDELSVTSSLAQDRPAVVTGSPNPHLRQTGVLTYPLAAIPLTSAERGRFRGCTVRARTGRVIWYSDQRPGGTSCVLAVLAMLRSAVSDSAGCRCPSKAARTSSAR